MAETLPSDDLILSCVGEWGNSATTYVIKNRLQSKGYRMLTPWVLRQMKRLERAGKVERAPTGYAVMICWRIPEPTNPGGKDERP